ncbi:MAG: polysaccharide biosynthesis/export family protein [Verrucomicrobiales bacterium]|nr:polysaccharide biosynthesis/export family protein [Verrucomicrobiales bacterium]
MKSIINLLFRSFAAMTLLVSFSACVHLKPADREFKTSAHFAPEDFDESESLTAEDALKQLPKEPDFEQLNFEKTIKAEYLRTPSGPYRVGPGDILDIEVAEKEETRAQTKVLPDGMLHYSVADGVRVSGMTLKEVSDVLSKKLADDYINPVVTVNVSRAESQRFWMLGQVSRPGAYPIQKPTTVIDAISQGGGLLSNRDGIEITNPEAADLERAILIRNGDLIPVDFEALIREGDMSQNVYVKGGDYVFVPSLNAQSIYVLGDVSRPGPVFYEKGVSLLSSVAVAGGTRPDAIVTKVLIIRGGTHRPKVAVVDLRAVMRGKEPDLALEGGDIVWVPESPWTKLKEYTESVLITAAQAVAVQEGLGVLGTEGGTGITINAGGN